MDGRHQAADDAELVIENLGDRRQAVRGAAGVGDDRLAGVGLVVHTVDEHRGRVLRRSGHDDFLRAGGDVLLRKLFGQEEAGGLDDDFRADFVPLQISRALLGGQADLLAVDDQHIALDRDLRVEFAVNRVILQHVGEVVRIEQVVDPDNFDVIAEILDCGAENHPTDTTETVDTNFDHFDVPLVDVRGQV